MLQNSITSTNTLLLRQVKVRTLQYKATIFLFALLLFAFWPQLSSMYQKYQTSKQDLQNTKSQHDMKKVEQATILKDVTLLQKISQDWQKNVLVQCYNTDCKTLPEDLKSEPQRSIVKAYLQLQQDTETKFTIDQKKLLAYLNEFLLKTDSSGAVPSAIKWITFGWASSASNNVKTIPTSISTTFANKDALLAFLRNIEQYVSPTFPMLAVVDSVTYDIVKSNDAQDVTIALTIYMLE